ncbi:MAG: 50S ribosomal protein L4, partial [Acidimicrobiia bacterium]|nr:50S ribosomal protein L4 [Acidimicrobiia bacterium]
REAKQALDTLGLTGKVLVVLEHDDVSAAKSFRNLPGVLPIRASQLNAYDILCSDWVVFTRATLPGSAQAAAAPAPAPTPEPASAPEPEPTAEEQG